MADSGWRRTAGLAYAWGAGAVFVASLLYFVYFYFVQLGRPHIPVLSRPAALLVDSGLFTVFSLHHSIMARARAKQWFARLAAPELERPTFVWFSSVLFTIVCTAWQHLSGDVYTVAAPLGWVLFALQLGGITFTLRAAARLDVLYLAGVRQVRQAYGIDRTAEPLQISGGYRLVRHPIYLGWVVMVFAAPHMTIDRLAFAIISTLYLVIGTPFEERALEREFGESYREYKRTVRWRFIPGLY
jgi:methanethiol S-methyltransferase